MPRVWSLSEGAVPSKQKGLYQVLSLIIYTVWEPAKFINKTAEIYIVISCIPFLYAHDEHFDWNWNDVM